MILWRQVIYVIILGLVETLIHPLHVCPYVRYSIWFKHGICLWFKSLGIGRSTDPYVLFHCGFYISRCFLSCLQSSENHSSRSTVDFFGQQVDQSQPLSINYLQAHAHLVFSASFHGLTSRVIPFLLLTFGPNLHSFFISSCVSLNHSMVN